MDAFENALHLDPAAPTAAFNKALVIRDLYHVEVGDAKEQMRVRRTFAWLPFLPPFLTLLMAHALADSQTSF